jgi:hypothetical protein
MARACRTTSSRLAPACPGPPSRISHKTNGIQVGIQIKPDEPVGVVEAVDHGRANSMRVVNRGKTAIDIDETATGVAFIQVEADDLAVFILTQGLREYGAAEKPNGASVVLNHSASDKTLLPELNDGSEVRSRNWAHVFALHYVTVNSNIKVE